MSHPVPSAALDDRLGFVGTAGSGKTYNAGSAVERLLARRSRCIIVDPLDVWWGLRLFEDGKTESPFKVVIFGGAHADLPLNEHAGALIGETVAGMAESCIVSLSTLGTNASERRFMLAFLTAVYRKASGEPVHLIFDEADLWAPQRLLDKEGEAAKLLGQMETIVRRGRIKGFIPWLITQRPAVLSKNVLSQIDGLVAFKLTSTQDRDAIGDWVEGQADKAEWNRLYGQLAAFQRGHGLVWVPGRGVLKDEDFPAKVTFDSSATPKRGETKRAADLKPLNVEALRSRLVSVEKEVTENDPRRLKAEVGRLKAELARKPAPAAPEDTKGLRAAHRAELKEAVNQAAEQAHRRGYAEAIRRLAPLARKLRSIAADAASVAEGVEKWATDAPAAPVPVAAGPVARPVERQKPAPAPRRATNGSGEGISGPMQRILDALAWWESVGETMPSRVQIAVVARYSPEGGAFMNPLGSLRTAGLVDYPQAGAVCLTDEGRRHANPPEEAATTEALHGKVMAILDGPRRRILEPLLKAYPDQMTREDLAAAAGYEPRGGAFMNPLGALRSLGLVDYPSPGAVVALPVLFVE